MNLNYNDDKYAKQLAKWNDFSASTSNEFFRWMDKSQMFAQIVWSNVLQAYRNKDMVDDIRQDIYLIHLNYLERDGEKFFLDFVNNRNVYRYWLVKVVQNVGGSDRSAHFRTYLSHRNTPIAHVDDVTVYDAEDAEVERKLLDNYNSNELKSLIGRILHSPAAQALFHKEEIDLYLWWYFGVSTTRRRLNFALKRLSAESQITYTTLAQMFNDIREFLLLKLDEENQAGKLN